MDYSYMAPATVPNVSSLYISAAMDSPYTYILSALVLIVYFTLSQKKSTEITIAVKDEEDVQEQLLQLEDMVQDGMHDLPDAVRAEIQRLLFEKNLVKSELESGDYGASLGLHDDEQDNTSIDVPSNVSQYQGARDALPTPSPRISTPPPYRPTTTTNHPKVPHANARLAECTNLPRLKPRRSFVTSRQTLQHPAPMVHSSPRFVSQPRFLENSARPAYHEQTYPPAFQQLPLHQAQTFPPVHQQFPVHQAQPAPPIYHQPLPEKPPLFAKLSSGIAQNFSAPQCSLSDLLVFVQWFAPSPQVQQPVEAPQHCDAPLNTFQPSNQGTLRPEAIPTDQHTQATNDDLPEDDHDMENQIMEDVEQPPNVDMDTGEDRIQVPAVTISPDPIAPSVHTEQDESSLKQEQYQYLQDLLSSSTDPVVNCYKFWSNLIAVTKNQCPESSVPTTSEQTQPELPPPETPATSEESEATAASYADFISAMVNTRDVPRGKGGDAFQYTAAQSRGAKGTRYPYTSMAQRKKEEDSLRNLSLKARSQKDTARQLPTMPLASSSTSPLRVGADGQRQAVDAERVGSEGHLRARLQEERELDARLIHQKKKREAREAKEVAKAVAEAKAKAEARARARTKAKAQAQAAQAAAETEANGQALPDADEPSTAKAQVEVFSTTQKLPDAPVLFPPAFSTAPRPLKRRREEEPSGLAPLDAGVADITKPDPIAPVKKRFRFNAPELLCEYKEFFKDSVLGPVAGTTTAEEAAELTRPSCLRLAPEAQTPRPLKTCLKPPRPFEHWYTNLYGPSGAIFAQDPSKRPRQAMESDSSSPSASSARLSPAEVHRLRVAARKEAMRKAVNKSLFSSVVATLSKPLTRKPTTLKTTSWVPTTAWSRTPTSNRDS